MTEPLLLSITRSAYRLRIEDPEQEAAIAVWMARRSVQADADECLVATVARRRLIDLVRKAARRPVLVTEGRQALAEPFDGAAAEARELVSLVPLEARERVVLDGWAAGATTAELASALGVCRARAHQIVAGVLARLAEAAGSDRRVA